MLVNLGKGLLACHFHKMMTNTSISYEKAGHVVIEFEGSDQGDGNPLGWYSFNNSVLSSVERPIEE